MDFSLTEQQRVLKDQITRFARGELSPGAMERDEAHEFSRELWRKCGAMGLQGLPVDPNYGGAGADPLSTAIGLEALGRGCDDGGLVFAVCAHLLACVVPIWKHGSEDIKTRYLPRLCDGTLVAVNAMTEPGGGSDAFSMKTRAVADGDDFVITGSKIFSSNGPVADVALVYAATAPEKGFMGGITAFLVEAGTPGFRRGQTFKKMGLNTCPIGELVFDEVRVPKRQIVGGVGGGGPIFSQSMEWERICLVAAHVGSMERLLDQAVDYARTRTSFGQKIGHYQAVAHKIADMKVRLEASRLLVYRAASMLGERQSVGMDASITKLFVSESLVRSALDTVQVL
ncbi:MAG: acyl-CoA dehydrogenase family protein, partial [Pseudomonadota bacterium]